MFYYAVTPITLLLTINSVNSLHQSVLDKYTPDQAYPELSCKNKCGESTPFCSCQSVCRLYRSCCEDFQDMCPDTITDVSAFRHLFLSTSVCHQSGYFMIEETPMDSGLCRSTQNYGDNDYANYTTDKNFIDYVLDQAPLTGKQQQSENLLAMIRSQPVTDLSTGVTYSTRETHSCYNNANKDVISSSSTSLAVWDLHVALESGRSFDSIDDFAGEVIDNPNSVSYQLSQEIKEAINGTNCRSNTIGTCPIGPLNEHVDPISADKCALFTTYVMSLPSRIIYNNIYCMLCWQGTINTSYDVLGSFKEYKRNIKIFSAVMKVMSDGLHIQYTPKEEQVSRGSWKEIRCVNKNKDFSNVKHVRCKAEKCEKETTLTKQGMCRFNRKLRVAFGADNMSLSIPELDNLPALFGCFLNTHYVTTRTFVFKNQAGVVRPFHFFNPIFNTDAYAFEINVMWTYGSLIIQNSQQKFLDFIGIFVKTFAKFRTHQMSHQSKRSDDNNSIHPQNSSEFAPIRSVHQVLQVNASHAEDAVKKLTLTYPKMGLGFIPGYQRSGPVLNTSACMCIQMMTADPSKVCMLTCWQNPWTEKDSVTVQKLLESPCLSTAASVRCRLDFLHVLEGRNMAWFLSYLVCIHSMFDELI